MACCGWERAEAQKSQNLTASKQARNSTSRSQHGQRSPSQDLTGQLENQPNFDNYSLSRRCWQTCCRGPQPDSGCNCAHFSVSFVKRLRVSEARLVLVDLSQWDTSVNKAPSWVNSLANVGEHLVAQLGMAGGGLMGAAPSLKSGPRGVCIGMRASLVLCATAQMA